MSDQYELSSFGGRHYFWSEKDENWTSCTMIVVWVEGVEASWMVIGSLQNTDK